MTRHAYRFGLKRGSSRHPQRSARIGLRAWGAHHELCYCALSLDEFAYSARSASDHAEASHRMRTTFLYLPLSPAIDQLILDVRAAL
jgi:hypothetical protein